MKKTLLLIASALMILSCSNESKDVEGYKLTGTITGIEDGKRVTLKRPDERNRPAPIDTAVVKDGKFVFEGKETIPEMHYLFVEGIQASLPVIIEGGTIQVEAYKDSLRKSKVTGTHNNDIFTKYLADFSVLGEAFREASNNLAKARRERDSVAMPALQEKYIASQNAMKAFEEDFIANTPDAYLSALLLERQFSSRAQTEEKVQELFDKLSAEVKETKAAKRLAEKLESIRATAIGAIAPNFTGKDPDGKDLALNDVKGKVTIVDFWASWCKPCRVENPNVVRVYNKYHDKGLNIIGVSLDRPGQEDKWKQAIADDKLAWNQVASFTIPDPIAQQYNVVAIPATFILDEKGAIVAKNLRGDALEEKVKELLGE